MTPNPVSLRDVATVPEAIALLADKGFGAAPVIDAAGRPVGVLSGADIVAHDREKDEYLNPTLDYYERSELSLPTGESPDWGTRVPKHDDSRVRDLMTPAVFSVSPDTPARQVVNEMVSLKVHRLFCGRSQRCPCRRHQCLGRVAPSGLALLRSRSRRVDALSRLSPNASADSHHLPESRALPLGQQAGADISRPSGARADRFGPFAD